MLPNSECSRMKAAATTPMTIMPMASSKVVIRPSSWTFVLFPVKGQTATDHASLKRKESVREKRSPDQYHHHHHLTHTPLAPARRPGPSARSGPTSTVRPRPPRRRRCASNAAADSVAVDGGRAAWKRRSRRACQEGASRGGGRLAAGARGGKQQVGKVGKQVSR